MIDALIGAFVLGLIGGVIPGPILAATFTEILQSGLSRGFRIVFWGMLTETCAALLSLVALSSLHLGEAVFRGFSFVGAVILVAIAVSVWKTKKIDTERRIHFSLPQISAMILSNGELWIYWVTVCVPKAIFLNEQLFFGQYVFVALVEVGWLVSTVATVFLFSGFRGVFSHPKAMPILFKAFALIFLYFAVSMTYSSAMFFLGAR